MTKPKDQTSQADKDHVDLEKAKISIYAVIAGGFTLLCSVVIVVAFVIEVKAEQRHLASTFREHVEGGETYKKDNDAIKAILLDRTARTETTMENVLEELKELRNDLRRGK